MAVPDLAGICGDLAAEHEALDSFVGPLDAPAWKTPTPAEGWDIGDAISHLAFFDEKATMAIVDPDAFASELAAVWEDPSILLGPDVERGRAIESAELLGWWRTARARLLDAAAACDPGAKVPWYGPPMNPVSFVSARLMETWAHGVDVLDALGVPVASTASGRLRHIAHIGVRTRGWSYTVRGLTAPTAPVRVELVPPGGGDPWVWGDTDAGDAVRGSALEFCLLVTQRRNRVDTRLDATGAAADEWLDIAQAFAGAPGPGRPPLTAA